VGLSESARQFPPQGTIFLMPVFFLLDDSLPAGVHGTSLPSLDVVVVAPFFAFAGQGGGAVEPDPAAAVLPGAAVLPAPPELFDVLLEPPEVAG
jgi:hypothetical protein